MNPNLKSITSFVLALSLFSQAALAGNGARDGNGSGDPTIAYTEEQADQIKQHLNLDYLKLTAAEIKRRDRKLQPIYDYYREATVQKVAQQIENTFGSNVYQYQSTKYGLYTPNLSDKASTMDSAVRFYTQQDVENTPFDRIAPSVLSGKGSISINSTDLTLKRVSGDESQFDEFCTFKSYYSNEKVSPFLLATVKNTRTRGGMIWDSHYEALYTSLENHIFEVPVLDNFLSAMKDSNLKGLDATLVFAADTVFYRSRPAPYQAVYPSFSKLAPIPQPMIFISKTATEEDLTKMLQEEAPKVYAYNQLFNQQMLPQAEQMAKALAKYPDVMQALKDAKSSVDQRNAEERLYDGFLTVTFGMLAAGLAPVTLAIMLASPILHPLLIVASTTVVIVP